jgi:hypothetical protein
MAGASAPRGLGDPANRVVVGTGGHDNPIDVKMSGSEDDNRIRKIRKAYFI